MGLGPPVCTKCMVIGKLNESAKKHPWRCPICKDWDMKGSLFTYVQSMQDIICRRTRFLSPKDPKIKKIQHTHTATRPFMKYGDREPNEYYRPWLEENVGKQAVDWDWDLSSAGLDILEIYFVTQEHATLFELTWP